VTADPVALVAAVRNGDSQALGALYDTFAVTLYRTALRLTGEPSEAEDVVHDCFVGLPEALRKYEERGTLGPWLTTMIVRIVLMRRRAEGRRREAPMTLLEATPGNERSDAAAESADARRAIAALPAALRDVFVLREVEGYTHDEIATLLGISVGASRVRLTRASEALRRALSHDRSPGPRP
jgi:RNA polymerase sigma-70 factor (ECF subfamily)